MKFQYKIPDSLCLRRTLSFCRSRRHINSCTSLERSWRQRLMWTLIIIIVVVVIVDDDTYYWVYLSSDPLFQVYYKVRQVLLQSATAFFLQSATSVITKCDSFFITKCDKCYYKVWQVLQSVTILLQSATGITKCDSTHVLFFISVHFFTVLGKSTCKITIFQVLQRTLTHRHKFEFFFLALTQHL